MAVSRGFSRKAPSEASQKFFECEGSGGAHGKAGKVPVRPESGPLREKIYGRPELDRLGGKGRK